MTYTKRAILMLFIILIINGCANASSRENNQRTSYMPSEKKYVVESIDDVTPIQGEGSRYIGSVYTISPNMALTFDGLPKLEKLQKLINLLEQKNATATFFVPGVRAAEEPELIKLIQQSGHEVQSMSLDKQDVRNKTYQQIYKSFNKSKQIIENSGVNNLTYIRTTPATDHEMIRRLAKHNEFEAVIGYSLFLKDEHLLDTFKSPKDLRLYIKRGGIVNIDIDHNEKLSELLDLLTICTDEVNYGLVSLSTLLQEELEFKKYDEIPKTKKIGYSNNIHNANYRVIENGNRDKNEVSLTIDDWGTDYTIVNIINILKEYDVPATFFLRANGVEHNPSLVRYMFEEGFEVANHTYSHPVLTTITDEEIQEQVVKTHEILTEAIQQEPLLLFRPPTGEYDERTAKAVASTGYKTIASYDLTTRDWDTANDAEAIVRTVTDNIKNGSIIVIHILDDLHTIEALPTLIEEVRERGYTFVPMSKMTIEQ